MTRSVGSPNPIPFNLLLDPIPKFRKPFTPTLGLPIAPLKSPDYEGTGTLCFRLSNDNYRVALLTVAHVARPPPAYTNTDILLKNARQPHDAIVALGSMGYQDATNAMMATIGDLARSITVWEDDITRLGVFVDGENPTATKKRRANQRQVEKATGIIGDLDKLHDEVTKHRTNPDQRIIGFVLHAEPIVASNEPNQFTRDWAFIELYNERIDWDTFLGNKLYIGAFQVSSRSFSFGRLFLSRRWQPLGA